MRRVCRPRRRRRNPRRNARTVAELWTACGPLVARRAFAVLGLREHQTLQEPSKQCAQVRNLTEGTDRRSAEIALIRADADRRGREPVSPSPALFRRLSALATHEQVPVPATPPGAPGAGSPCLAGCLTQGHSPAGPRGPRRARLAPRFGPWTSLSEALPQHSSRPPFRRAAQQGKTHRRGAGCASGRLSP